MFVCVLLFLSRFLFVSVFVISAEVSSPAPFAGFLHFGDVSFFPCLFMLLSYIGGNVYLKCGGGGSSYVLCLCMFCICVCLLVLSPFLVSMVV